MTKTRILIVEDEFIVASDLENRLLALGYEVSGRADTGPDAVEMAGSTRPDLVLMDIRLKGGSDGIAAAEAIRPRFGVPVVFVTAFADESTLERAKAAEPYGYILKPFENRELRTIIEIALYKHKSDREIQRLNRLYAALSRVNEIAIRAESRNQLFSNVCKAATETAGFKLAWIGGLNHTTRAIEILAGNGQGLGYLNSLRIYADERPEGCGPTGTCARTEDICIFNDLLNDPRSAFKRAASVEYGFRAAAALPLRWKGKLFGVFTVYADELDAFKDKEIGLLREAAADISFALDHLEQQAQMKKLVRAVEQSPALILITDAKGRIEYVNPKFTSVTGYASEEVLGRNPRLLKSGETPQHEYRRMWEMIIAGKEWRGEFHNHKKNGELYWESASISPITDADGKVTNFLAVKEDITERKRTDEALRDSETKWRSYLENAPVGILVTGPDGKHVEANRAAEQMLGYPSGGLLGTSARDIPANPADPAVAKHFEEIRAGGYSEGEFELRRKDGTTMWASVRALRLSGDRLMGVFQDVTRHRQLEMELRQAQKLEAVARLAGGVAHDFNNVLAAILMQLSLLQMKYEFDQETRDTLKELDAAAGRGASIARQLLMFSRTSAMSVRPLNLNDVFEGLLKMLRRLIGEDIDLQFDPGTERHWVEADLGMMEQVLMNLVVNARDAMPGGGRITVLISNVHIGSALAARNPNRREGQFACLTTADAGCGMDAATMKRIFEPFFTTKEPGKGTGLGLATVYGIVTQHKGWIEVESRVGAGTHFRVYLPACAPPGAESIQDPHLPPTRGGAETILLVEDDSAVRRPLAQTLRILGYAVHEAPDGKAALELFQAKSLCVDLLLTDMVMPNGVNGLELIERLRALKPGLKAIILSGYSEQALKADAPAKPGVTYLSKPCRAPVLAEAVRRSLDQKD